MIFKIKLKIDNSEVISTQNNFFFHFLTFQYNSINAGKFEPPGAMTINVA